MNYIIEAHSQGGRGKDSPLLDLKGQNLSKTEKMPFYAIL